MLKNEKVICPTCGGEVVEFDTIDIEVNTASVTLFKVGGCNRCGNHYQWHEEYALAGYRDLEQTNDEFGDLDLDEEWGDDGNLEAGFDPYEGCYTYDC